MCTCKMEEGKKVNGLGLFSHTNPSGRGLGWTPSELNSSLHSILDISNFVVTIS